MKRIVSLLVVILWLATTLAMALPVVGQEVAGAANMATARRFMDLYWGCKDVTLENTASLLKSLWRLHYSAIPLTFAFTPYEMKTFAEHRCAGFPDSAYEITHLVAQDDLVWVHYTFQGTFKAKIMDNDWWHCEPSGKLETEEGILLFRFDEGKIAEYWWYSSMSNGCLYIAGQKPACEAMVRKQQPAPTAVPAATLKPVPGEQVAQAAELKVQVDGQTTDMTLPYLLYLPVDYEAQAEQRWPLVIFLHGAGEWGEDLKMLKIHGVPKLVSEGQDFPFVAAAPQLLPGVMWSDQTAAVAGLIQSLEGQYRIDAGRVYVMGISLGGNGTWQFAADYPDIPAAIVPIAGWYGPFGATDVPENICDLKDMPIRVYHGAQDTTVPLEASQVLVDALKKCGAAVEFTVYPDADHGPTFDRVDNTPELYEWLLAQSK